MHASERRKKFIEERLSISYWKERENDILCLAKIRVEAPCFSPLKIVFNSQKMFVGADQRGISLSSCHVILEDV